MSAAFHSYLAGELTRFLAFKRALGYPYHRAESSLCAFDKHLVAQRAGRRQRLIPLMLAWLGRSSARKPVSVACEMSVLRQFHAFLQRRGYGQLREPAWPQVPATSQHVPYVLTREEVRTLLKLTNRLDRPPFRRILYRTLLLVLYCTGLRFGEAVRLRLRDVDAVRGILFVMHSKGRSRWVPCHRSLCREIQRYLRARGALAPDGPDASFFVGRGGAALSTKVASYTVRRLLRIAGIKPAAGRVGPRPYDMRHAFAVHRLTRWYRAGVDLHARLPWLSAYMGHEDLLGTESYLTATPELLALAGARFHRRVLSDRRSN